MNNFLKAGGFALLCYIVILYLQLLADDHIRYPYDLSISMAIADVNHVQFYVVYLGISFLLAYGFGIYSHHLPPIVQIIYLILCWLIISSFAWLKYYAHKSAFNRNETIEKFHTNIAKMLVLSTFMIASIMVTMTGSYVTYILLLLMLLSIVLMAYFSDKWEKIYNGEYSAKDYSKWSSLFASQEVISSILFVVILYNLNI